jgi:dihydroceramidase
MKFDIRREFNPQPDIGKGLWGIGTSSLDWCEQNYVVTEYIAEFWNTISNSNYILLAILGVWSCYRVKAEARDYLTFICGCGAIGVGSWLFHMTLLYPLQLSDELPMIYGTCVHLYCLVNMIPPEKYRWVSGTFLAVYAVSVTAIYEYTRIPVFFQSAYGLLAAVGAIIPLLLISKITKNHPRETGFFMRTYAIHLCSYLFGFFLWNLDNLYCDQIRIWRQTVPWPIASISQLHAWWHMFTGYGGYGTAVIALYMRQLALGRNDVEVRYLGIYPYVSKKLKLD